MDKCRHCDREIRGEPAELTVTVDESVPMLPEGETVITFCSDRCKRDWLDGLIGMEWATQDASVNGGKDDG